MYKTRGRNPPPKREKGDEMAWIGWQELIIILVILIFIFGASRITGLGRALGQAVREFKKATSGVEEKKEEREEKEKQD